MRQRDAFALADASSGTTAGSGLSRAVAADEVTATRSAEKSGGDQGGQHRRTGGLIEPPQSAGLRLGQSQSGHLEKLAADPAQQFVSGVVLHVPSFFLGDHSRSTTRAEEGVLLRRQLSRV